MLEAKQQRCHIVSINCTAGLAKHQKLFGCAQQFRIFFLEDVFVILLIFSSK
jgi:hypothetical protein